VALTRALAVLSFVLLAAVGCDKKKADATPAPSASASVTAAPDSPATRARALALASPPGSGAISQKIEGIERAIAKNPTKVDFWVLLGRAWVQKARESNDPGFYLNANACADIAIELEPSDRAALDLRGLVLLNNHRFEEARALARSIVDRNPEDPMAYGTLSDALLEIGDFDGALNAAQKMMDLKPNLPAYSRASYFRWLMGDDEGALNNARSAIDAGYDAKDPEPRAWQLVQAAMIFWHKGDYEGADAGFDKALEAVRDYAPAFVGKGRVALAKNDPKRAAELFRRAYAESPLPETSWLLGDALELAGDSAAAAAARADVEKHARQSDPRTLALFWATRGEHVAEALALAQAEKKTRGDVYTDDVLAWALHKAGKSTEARIAIDRARSHGTKDARLMFHQGAIHIATGDVAGGKKLVSSALALNPKFDVIGEREARALVAGPSR
jgi:tetratricopeptide (TPR) repeat protein